jgi:YD repeat-containing protein
MSGTKLLLLFLFVAFTKCFAQNVNTKNGDFYVSYTDAEFKDHPLGFEISRSYHSRAVEKGWFGMGWGSNYESRLHTVPGGGIIVYSWGKIGFEMFKPMQWDMQGITKAVNKMATIAQQKLDVQTPQEIAGFKNKLINDEDERIKYWLRYLEEGLVEEIKITAGNRLAAVTGGTYYIQVLDKGYKIPVNEGHTRFFDSTGRLQKLVNQKSDEITFSYDEDGYPSVIRDNLNNALSFTFDDEGLIRNIVQKQANGKTGTSFYTYDPNTQTLLSSRDIEANYYQYEWDPDFYLTRIVYTEGTDTKITYDANGLATSVKRKDGSKTVYTYPTPSSKEYGTTTTDFDSLGNKTKSNSEWFVLKTDDLGKDWIYKKIIVNNDDSVTIISDERFQLPDTVYLNKGNIILTDMTTKEI